MVVSIDFCGTQRVVTKTHSIRMPITERTKVTDAIQFVRQQYPHLRLDERMVLITVNHELAHPDRLLRANDTVAFLPPVGGG